jgi:hypothetical protein
MDHRERVWRETLSDQELVEAFRESEKGGPLITRMTNSIMRPTPYSPLQ